MLNILKKITSLIKKKHFLTFMVVCLLIFLCENSYFLQIIEGNKGRKFNLRKTIRRFGRKIKKNRARIQLLEEEIYPINSIKKQM
jgi:hypothetical protein|uniref:Uncharacterized protein n=1 Tax=viral metagenome TaxID=1070528 RepID=A0A6C0IPE2_9ZZZZ